MDLTVKSQFLIGSVTQIFTAVLTLILHKKKLLNIDDPVSNYVKSKVDNFKDITVRDVIMHLSLIHI